MRAIRLLGLCLMMFVLAACTGKPVKTYEGEVLAEAERALLIASENIEVKSINGKKMREYMLKNIETHYALKPGINSVVFIHTSLWATADRNSDTKSETIESSPQYLEFDARAGGVYSFQFEQPSGREEAKRAAGDFTANLITASGGLVATSALHVPSEPEISTTDGAVQVVDGVGECPRPGSEMSGLDIMKKQWDRMSQKDRKAFLKWAFK